MTDVPKYIKATDLPTWVDLKLHDKQEYVNMQEPTDMFTPGFVPKYVHIKLLASRPAIDALLRKYPCTEEDDE